MMWENKLQDEVQKLLPIGAKLVGAQAKGALDDSPSPFIQLSDLDGDGEKELAAIYRWVGETFLTVWKKGQDGWYAVQTLSSRKAAIRHFQTAPVTGRKKAQLIIGWRLAGEDALAGASNMTEGSDPLREDMAAQPAALAVYEWTPRGLVNRVGSLLSFEEIEVADLPSVAGGDGVHEIILWQREPGVAGGPHANIYKWNGSELSLANDRYPAFFQQLAASLQEKTQEEPGSTQLWYQLARAQQKAGQPAQAVATLATAVKFGPSAKQEWEGFIRLIRRELESRAMAALFPASVKTAEGVKWGYIDGSGRFVIQPHYEYAEDFQQNGLAIVQMNNRSGLINKLGSFVVSPVYQSIAPFSEGRAAVIDDRGFRVIDEKGRILTPQAYSYIGTYKEGRALFNKTDAQGRSAYGYLDRDGREAIGAQYLAATDFQDGKAVVQVREGEYALIDTSGRILQTYPYASVGPLGDGLLAFARTADGPKGYLDESGRVVIEPQYSVALPFEDGRAIVNASVDFTQNQYGLIDKTGAYLIPPEYNDLELLGEGRVALGKAIDPNRPYLGSTYAIADADGPILTDFLYENVGRYKEGVASVSDGRSTFFIDRRGQRVSNLPIVPGSGTLTLMGELVKADVDQRVSYYDRNGKRVWQQNTIIPLREPYRIVEHKYAPNKNYLVYYPEIKGIANRAAREAVNNRLKELSQVKPIDPNAQLDYSYSGDFAVAFFRKQLVELELTGYNFPFGAAHGMPTRIYVPIDLVSGRIYSLKDLFKPGSDYVRVLSELVGNQIRTNPEYSYVFPDSYKGISPDQPFYVKADALYLYFAPYEIAPYAAGFPTFRIPFSEISGIIDESGEFWRSFH